MIRALSEDKIGYRYSVSRYFWHFASVDGGFCGVTVDRQEGMGAEHYRVIPVDRFQYRTAEESATPFLITDYRGRTVLGRGMRLSTDGISLSQRVITGSVVYRWKSVMAASRKSFQGCQAKRKRKRNRMTANRTSDRLEGRIRPLSTEFSVPGSKLQTTSMSPFARSDPHLPTSTPAVRPGAYQ